MPEFLIIIFQVLFWIAEINIIYYGILYLVGMLFHRQKYQMKDDEQKFCIFVPCHNEQNVVEATVKDFLNINYNKDLFDIYFIADNCTDKTTQILRRTIEKYGAKNFFILERNVDDPNKKGKPHAINWAIEKLENKGKFYEKYDQMMILDADNFVDPGILKHINSQYLSYKPKKRPAIIQCYADSKNKNTFIARSYYAQYRISNGFSQLPKQKLHLVPAVAGTGFCVETKFLESIGGYKCTSLTEDLEIQTLATIHNKRVLYNQNVRVYDEKPTRFKQSVVQRTRWAQGHWFLAFKYIPRLILSLFNLKTIKATFRKLDMIVYLCAKFFITCALISILFSIYFLIFPQEMPVFPSFLFYLNTSLAIFAFIIVPVSSIYDGKKPEKKSILKDFIPNVIAIYLLTFIEMIASVVGLFKCPNQKVWKKTVHQVTTLNEGKFTEDDLLLKEKKEPLKNMIRIEGNNIIYLDKKSKTKKIKTAN